MWGFALFSKKIKLPDEILFEASEVNDSKTVTVIAKKGRKTLSMELDAECVEGLVNGLKVVAPEMFEDSAESDDRLEVLYR